MHKQRHLARMLACLLVLLLVYAGNNAAKTLEVGLVAYSDRQAMRRDFNQTVKLSEGNWQVILEKLHRAVTLQPDNPDLLHQLGRAWMQSHRYESDSDGAAIAARRNAVDYFRRAIIQRPSWPHDRMDYLLARYRLGDIDDSFYQQLLAANLLGPWEAWVQQVTAEIGLQLGDRLPLELHEILDASIVNGVQHPDGTKAMLEVLRRYNSLDRVCGKVNYELVIQFCRRYFAASRS